VLSAIAVPAKIMAAKVVAVAIVLMCFMFQFSGAKWLAVVALPLVISIGEWTENTCEKLPEYPGNIHEIACRSLQTG